MWMKFSKWVSGLHRVGDGCLLFCTDIHNVRDHEGLWPGHHTEGLLRLAPLLPAPHPILFLPKMTLLEEVGLPMGTCHVVQAPGQASLLSTERNQRQGEERTAAGSCPRAQLMRRGSEPAASLTSELGTPLRGELRPTLFQARVVLQTQSHTTDFGYFLIVSSLCFVICLKPFLIH